MSKLPAEILAVEGQVLNADQRFRFAITFHVEDMPAEDYKAVNDQLGVWTAGSIEELLAGIQAVKIALEHTPGVAQSFGRLPAPTGEPRICTRCGFEIAKVHTVKECLEKLRRAVRKQTKTGRQW